VTGYIYSLEKYVYGLDVFSKSYWEVDKDEKGKVEELIGMKGHLMMSMIPKYQSSSIK